MYELNCNCQRIKLKRLDSQGIEIKNEYNIGGQKEKYPGPYTVTPSSSQQIFNTNDKECTQNFVVEPIPSNYGLVTYNGFSLTIS